jgi:hypothetical protein
MNTPGKTSIALRWAAALTAALTAIGGPTMRPMEARETVAAPRPAAPAEATAVESTLTATELITKLTPFEPAERLYACISNPETALAALWMGKYKTPIKKNSTYNPYRYDADPCPDESVAEFYVPVITHTELLGKEFAIIYPSGVVTASMPISLYPKINNATWEPAAYETWQDDGKWRAFGAEYAGEATIVSRDGVVLSSSDWRTLGPGLLFTKILTDFNIAALTLITTPWGLGRTNSSINIRHGLFNGLPMETPGHIGRTLIEPNGLLMDSYVTKRTADGRIAYYENAIDRSQLFLRTSGSTQPIQMENFYNQMTASGNASLGWISQTQRLVAPNTILATGWFTSAETGRPIEFSARTTLATGAREVRTTYTFSDSQGIGFLQVRPHTSMKAFNDDAYESLVFDGTGFAYLVDERFDRGWGVGYELGAGVKWEGFAVERSAVQSGSSGQLANSASYFTTSVKLGPSTTITDAANVYNGSGTFVQRETEEWYGGYRYDFGAASEMMGIAYSYSSTNPAATVISFTHRMSLIGDTLLSFDARLGELSTLPGVMKPEFVSKTTSYTAEVLPGTTSMVVTATVNQVSATMAYASTAGSCTPDDTSPASCAIAASGTTTITVTVLAANGITTKTYEIYVKVLDLDDASLSELSVLPGVLSPAFVSTTTSYAAGAPNGTTSVAVTATVNHVSATVAYASTAGSCTPNNASPASCAIAASGATTITITVTAADLKTTETYTIVVTAADAGASTDATLGELSVLPGVLSPAFVSTTTSYTAGAPNGTTSVAVTATVNQVSATVAYASTAGVCTPEDASPASCAIAASGATTITITVTAADLTTTETYTIVVTAADAGASNDATLADLVVALGALSPAFVSTTTDYEASVANDVASTPVTPTLNDPNATYTITGSPGACTPATSPANCALSVGVNVITVTVTAEDGSVQEYTITIVRAAPLTTIDRVWPGTGVAAGGMPVQIFGTGFVAALTVTVGPYEGEMVSVPFTIENDEQIAFVMPPGVAGQQVSVTVQTAGATQTAVNAFTYVAPDVIEFDGEVGGVFTTTDGAVVTIPPQGVSGSFYLTMTPQPPAPGVPGDVLMYSFRLDAVLNGIPLTSLTNPVTITLPIDEGIFAIADGERPWLYQWVGGEERGKRSEEREEERSALTSHSSPLTSLSSGRWVLVRGQQYEPTTQVMTVALRPMGEYALTTSVLRANWLPLLPVLR